MIFESQCSYCKHFHEEDHRNETCSAFPDGIPKTILENIDDHRSPYPGDHGIRFEPTEQALELFGEQGPFAEQEPAAEPQKAERVA